MFLKMAVVLKSFVHFLETSAVLMRTVSVQSQPSARAGDSWQDLTGYNGMA